MNHLSHMTAEEVSWMKEKATLFYITHATQVEKLAFSTKHQIAPSKSDLLHPELWTGIHWRWYFSLLNLPLNQKKTSWWRRIFS